MGMSEGKDALTDKQGLAITLLVQGLNDTEVAEKVGVTRETVNRWRHNGDDAFKVALNAAREQVWEDALARLRALVSDAVTVLEGSVRSDKADVRVAVAILKAVGVYGAVGKPAGPVTLRELEREKASRVMSDLLADSIAGM